MHRTRTTCDKCGQNVTDAIRVGFLGLVSVDLCRPCATSAIVGMGLQEEIQNDLLHICGPQIQRMAASTPGEEETPQEDRSLAHSILNASLNSAYTVSIPQGYTVSLSEADTLTGGVSNE